MARLKPTAGIKHPLRINKENVWDRKKALKHCVRKLRHIEDPETQLHQAVLLNNTLQRIRTMTSGSCEAEPRVLQPASNNNTSLGSKESSLVTSEDIFSELSLPPPLNTNQLAQLTISQDHLPTQPTKHNYSRDREKSIYSYYHAITNYHLEDEINLFDSLIQNCDDYILSENALSMKRTQ